MKRAVNIYTELVSRYKSKSAVLALQMTVAKFTKFILPLVLLLTANVFAFAQSEVCGITTFFVDLDAKASSSRFFVGGFDLQLIETYDDVTKSFHHKESGVDVAVSATLTKGIFDGEPMMLNTALSFTAKPGDNDFELLDGAKAQSIYDERWRWLSVSDDIKVGNRIYTFIFACEK